MTIKQARAALLAEGVKPTDPHIDIVDAIFEHMPNMPLDDANVLAGDLAYRIAE